MIRTVLCALLVTLTHLSGAQDRSRPPLPGPPPPLRLPPVQQTHLSNGLPVMMMEKRSVPLVEVVVVVRTGSVRDPESLEGLASITAALLTRGAGARSALELAGAVDDLGATLTAEAGRHSSSLSLFCPRQHLADALGLMGDALLRPAFPDSELAREQASRLTTVRQWRESPEILADIALQRELYGRDHPYGRPVLGTEEGIAAVSAGAVREFYRRWYHASNAGVIAVGDVTMDALLPLLEAAFGAWATGPEIAGAVPPAPQISERRSVLIDRPGATQTEIRVGRIGAARMTDDYEALMVLNTVLGGSFSSRLNTNLREVHGYTYGAGSEFDCRLMPGPFVVWTSVESAVTDSALQEIVLELERIREPVPEEEIRRAASYLALSYPTLFQTVSSTARQLDELYTYGLPPDYHERYVGRVLSVSAGDVRQAARRYIDPSAVITVLVGDRATIEEPVRALGLGPLTVTTPELLLVPRGAPLERR